jgi:L-ascorbate metabolism protein UlaG (beta-lactamase superfamily)
MIVGAMVASVVVLLVVANLVGCSLSAPVWRGPTTDHFDGERFRNEGETEHAGFGSMVKWMVSRDPGPWKAVTDAPFGPLPPARVGAGELRVTFVNHATVLVQVDGLNLLTDPVWSDRVSPFSWVGPERQRPPGLRFEDVPKIDAVLLSHNHYDHLDEATIRRLVERDKPKIYSGLGMSAWFEAKGMPATVDLDWWQGADLTPQVRVTAVPARHFSGRGTQDRDKVLWVGFVVQSPAGAVYFAGDTGMGPHFQQIGQKFAPLRLALLPIGAFRPTWFMSRVHVSPAEAVEAQLLTGARTAVAIHFGTFKLADDGQDEPVVELHKALDAKGKDAPRFWVLGFGEGRDVPQ